MKKPEIGGLFMAGLPGTALDGSTQELIEELRVGSFILFKRNVAEPDQLRRLCGDLRAACLAAGLPAPLIAIDQEGGTVTRLPPPFTQFPDARVLAAAADPWRALTDYGRTCARELREIGVNMNLAPVLDVCPAGKGCFMERRALGEDPGEVARLGRVVISAMQDEGVAACGKHFPGLGAAVLDPHERLPRVDRSLPELRRLDLPPFREAAAEAAAIMTSHTLYPALDPEWPATLSRPILTGLLREEIGFTGVIVTDDLEMGAIEKEGPLDEAALRAFEAGADLLLICHDHGKVRRAREKLAAAAGRIPPSRIAASLARIAAVRSRFAS
ncbi:MAG: beta-N-acetylhexosaminidase [Desulfobacteraceae bacterium]|nr:beta-N-acetylhexosaminidase [Desulfobacteraceae bacterium]